MTFFSKLGDDAGVRDIVKMNVPAGLALIDYHERVMRQPSALSPAQRELIAAFVSGLNACRYCHGVHQATARAMGIDQKLLEALLEDLDNAPLEARLKPLLRYAKKLTLEPASLRAGDAEAVFAAGHEEQALHDAINVVCLFNFMNRLVEGHGIEGNRDLYLARGEALGGGGYLPLRAIIKKDTA